MFDFIRQLSVARKLALASAAFLIPNLVLMGLFLSTINGHIDFANKERHGIEYLRPLVDLMHHLPRHHLLICHSHLDDDERAEQLQHVEVCIDAAMGRLLAVDALLGESLGFTRAELSRHGREYHSAQLVAQDWKELKDRWPACDDQTREADHRRLVAKLRAMVAHVGDTSNLLVDPDLDATYLMHIALLVVPSMQERMGIIAEAGEEYLTESGRLSPAELDEFKVNIATIREAEFKRAMTAARTALAEDQLFYGTSTSLQRRMPPTIEKFDVAVGSFIDMAASLVDSTKPTVEMDKFIAAGVQARRACIDLWLVAAEELDGLLQTRIAHYAHVRTWGALLAALAFIAALKLGSFITFAISRPLEQQADDLRRAKEAIEENNRRTQTIIEAAPDCIVTMDGAGKVIHFNEASEQTFHYKREEAVGRLVEDLIIPDECQRPHREGLERYLRTGEGRLLGRRIEVQARRADGSTFPIELAISVVTESGDPTFIAFISDISARKQAEDELKRLYAETQLLLTSIPSVLIHFDSGGNITRWNAAAESVFGIPAVDAVGRSCRVLPWSDASVPRKIEELAEGRGGERFPHVVVHRSDGQERIIDITVSPVLQDGDCSGLLLLGNDRTELEQLERSLAQAQKLEAIGQLAAGIAHEINTPMQFVCDNIEFLSDCSEKLCEVVDAYQQCLAADGPEKSWEDRHRAMDDLMERNQFVMIREEVPRAIAESLEGAQRVIHIVRAMREFSHLGNEQKVGVDLNNAIRSTATITRNRWKYVAELKLDLDPDVPTLDCVPAEVNQVLLNLIVNAADAITERVEGNGGERGAITVRTAARNAAILIEVEDTGCGIPEAIRQRIFEPFFTTKDVGKGSGQGLAICYNLVVSKYHGSIQVESTPGVGTIFRVSLPSSRVAAAECEGRKRCQERMALSSRKCC